MKVIEYIRSKLRLEKLHMTLIDPEKLSPDDCADVAYSAFRAGSDAIMVGGSTGISTEILDESVVSMKEAVPIPIIQFPSHSKALSSNADALYFMSLLNSKSRKYIVEEQKAAALALKNMDIELIPMGYVIVEPGMVVGKMGDAEALKRNDTDSAVGYGLAAEFFGMDLFYLEAGSGAPEPVPQDMIEAVKSKISIPLIVGGGIREAETAAEVSGAGADIVVTGTIVEITEDVEEVLRSIVMGTKGSFY